MNNSKPLTIAFVTNNWIPYSGGVVSSITTAVNELRSRGHTVFIITLDFLGSEQPAEKNTVRLPCFGRFLYKKNHMAFPWRMHTALRKHLAQIKPDLVHVHHPFLLGPAAVKAARALNVPVVFTYHTLYEEYAHYVPLPKMLVKPIISKLINRFCAEVDGIIAPSSSVATKFAHENIKTPVTIIPSSINPLFFTDRPKQRDLGNKPFNLLTVTRFAKEKNIPLLLNVFAALPHTNQQFSLTLIGYGSELSALQHYAYTTLQLSPVNVQFIVHPPKEFIAQHYATADLFLFSSTTDTQGLVLAEAMAAGTPVVAIDGPGQRDIIEQGKNGYLVANAQEMAAKITALANDPVTLHAMRIQAHETGKKYHSSLLTEKLLLFYSELLP